jgi:hypothetical protein
VLAGVNIRSKFTNGEELNARFANIKASLEFQAQSRYSSVLISCMAEPRGFLLIFILRNVLDLNVNKLRRVSHFENFDLLVN